MVDSRKTSSSNYQKEKARDWKKKSDDKAENSNKSGDDKSNGKDPNEKSNGMQKCYRCDRRHWSSCSAINKRCLKCGEKGHFQVVCKDPEAAESRVGRIQVVN